jgi:hypothetical protein
MPETVQRTAGDILPQTIKIVEAVILLIDDHDMIEFAKLTGAAETIEVVGGGAGRDGCAA